MTAQVTDVVTAFVGHLKTGIPMVQEVYDEFPRPDEEIKVPSISIITVGNGRITNNIPTILPNVSDDPLVPENGKFIRHYRTGEYDLTLQLDIWAEYKQVRANIFDQLSSLMVHGSELNDVNHGLNLSLDREGYPYLARYEITDYNYLDGENMAAKSEWRASVSIQCHFPKIDVVSTSRMESIELESEINQSVTGE